MDPNPYQAPREQGYHPPAYKVSVRTCAFLFSAAFVLVIVIGLGADTYLPAELFGMNKIWVVMAGQLLIMFALSALLFLGRVAGLIEKPVPRARA